MTVGIVYGGTSEERFASEKNAHDICVALKSKGYDVTLFEYRKDLIETLRKGKVDVVFLCVQGKGHGDGTLQGMLEHEGIPFTGSGMRAASLINDKILCKLLFDKFGISTPRWDILTKKQYNEGTYNYEKFGFPFVAKAPTQGGSFGIELIKGRDDIHLIEEVFKYDDPILLEEYIRGNFFTVGFYERKGELITLPPVEGIEFGDGEKYVSQDELVKFTGKYGIKRNSLDYDSTEKIIDMAKKVFEVTMASGLGRVDFMISEKDIKAYVLEINAVPGLKRSSLMPLEAELMNINYEDMIEDILLSALK